MSEALEQYKIEHVCINGHRVSQGLLSIHNDKLKFETDNHKTFTFLIAKILIHAIRKTDNSEGNNDSQTELYSQFRQDGLLDEAAAPEYLGSSESEAAERDEESDAEDEEMKFAEVAFTFSEYEIAHKAFNLIENRVRAHDEAEMGNQSSSGDSESEGMDDEDDIVTGDNCN